LGLGFGFRVLGHLPKTLG